MSVPPDRRARTWSLAPWALTLTVGVLLAAAVPPLVACGPFFPSSLLSIGDDAVLQAPTVQFLHELQRLRLEPPPRLAPARIAGVDRDATTDAEIFDLRRALGRRLTDTNVIADLVRGFSRSRADLEDFVRESNSWSPASSHPRPELRLAPVPDGVPREFALYLEAAAAWHDGRKEDARRVWSDLLQLPAVERPFKTTWATYMLGRSWHEEDPARAAGYYEQTRKFARAGLTDTAGLAVASLGWQGQLRLRTNDLAGALRLYLDQFAAGTTNAYLSLAFAARRVTEAPAETREAIARDPLFRSVVTAWVLADYHWIGEWGERDEATPDPTPAAPQQRWLAAIEASGAADVRLAEQLAVLSYQAGDWDAAQRWVDLAGDSPVAAWIHAKLLLRNGHLDEAAETLARVTEHFPVDPPEPSPSTPPTPPAFVDSLFDRHETVAGRREALGELGVLHLGRGEFTQALDALLRGRFWQDAAYVAERVLTLDELKTYVDQTWPLPPPKTTTKTHPDASTNSPAGLADVEPASDCCPDATLAAAFTPEVQRDHIRHLLARRLNRVGRRQDAAAYLPAALRPAQTQYADLIRHGADASRPARERAQSWFTAAWLARTNGLELLGTELGPDYAIWDAQFEEGPGHLARAADPHAKLLRPTAEETRRADTHVALPEQRFHYRYTAARLAWDAAQLLPNNDPETAFILYTGGSWLKYRDPETADLFYKALVRRCRKTELGDAADRQRWFPELDDDGKPIVTRRPVAPSPTSSPDAPATEAPSEAVPPESGAPNSETSEPTEPLTAPE